MGSCIIYLTGFSVFIGEKSGPEYEKKKKKKKDGQKNTLYSLKTPRGSLQHSAP